MRKDHDNTFYKWGAKSCILYDTNFIMYTYMQMIGKLYTKVLPV